MNNLAHLYLAEPTSEGLLGSLFGDFVKGRPGHELPGGVRAGIYLHRRIDAYTDAHPVHRRSRRRFAPHRRRFAGIIVDVCYDHFLSRAWSSYSDEPLGMFTGRVYAILASHPGLAPRTTAAHSATHDRAGLARILR